MQAANVTPVLLFWQRNNTSTLPDSGVRTVGADVHRHRDNHRVNLAAFVAPVKATIARYSRPLNPVTGLEKHTKAVIEVSAATLGSVPFYRAA